MNILDQRPSVAVEEFLTEYNRLYPIDRDHARRLIQQATRDPSTAHYWLGMEDRWYQSLRPGGQSDYGIYNDEYYFTDLWACWSTYSRKYLKTIDKPGSLTEHTSIRDLLTDINTAVDMGCGIGYSTAALRQLFPQARVLGYNLADSPQSGFCERMSQRYGFELVHSIEAIPVVDFLFASEYYEHIYTALDEINHIARQQRPRFLYLASSFNTRAPGHFTEYKSLGHPEPIDQSQISRTFNRLLEDLGYERIRTRNWNNKPTLWRRKDTR